MTKITTNSYTKICDECGRDINYPFEKVYRLEDNEESKDSSCPPEKSSSEQPAIDAYEAEFCSRKCMVMALMCSECKHMKKNSDGDDECELNPDCALEVLFNA